jgi:hypothetical protein
VINSPVPALVTGMNVLNPDTGEPTFEWLPSNGATWYQIAVTNPLTGLVFQKWYPAADLGCAAGGTCTITPPIMLKNGNYTWSVRAWGPGGYNNGDSSQWAADTFSVNAPAAGVPTLIAPSGAISNPNPEFSWNSVTGGTWYHIWVEYNGSRIYHKWLSATELGCAGGGVCAKTEPTINLNPAAYLWKVQAYTPAGVGGWSSTMGFTIVP